MHITKPGQLFILIIVLSLSACASVVTKPAKPIIKLVGVKPLNISVTEQRLRFELQVINPNAFEMPVESVDFVARLNDTNIANGKSNHSVVIGANSEARLSLDVTASLTKLTSSLNTLIKGNSLNLDYALSGTVKVATWPKPIPFDVIGAMDLEDS